VDIYGWRVDESQAEPNRSHIVSKGYWFLANGKKYRGYVIYKSDEARPSLAKGETRSERIRYLFVFPYINKPAMLCDFDDIGAVGVIYHIFAPMGCLFLMMLVIRTPKGKQRKKKATRKPAEKPQRT
jgi:hypothetical protein